MVFEPQWTLRLPLTVFKDQWTFFRLQQDTANDIQATADGIQATDGIQAKADGIQATADGIQVTLDSMYILCTCMQGYLQLMVFKLHLR